MTSPGDPIKTEQDLLEFFKNFQWPKETSPSFRLYYSDSGRPVCYTMDELPGNYIEITAEEFKISDPHVKVKDGKIVKLAVKHSEKLTPSDHGVACAKSDITVVVAETEPHQKWSLKLYEEY
jgi:hypothetical protein